MGPVKIKNGNKGSNSIKIKSRQRRGEGRAHRAEFTRSPAVQQLLPQTKVSTTSRPPAPGSFSVIGRGPQPSRIRCNPSKALKVRRTRSTGRRLDFTLVLISAAGVSVRPLSSVCVRPSSPSSLHPSCVEARSPDGHQHIQYDNLCNVILSFYIFTRHCNVI